MVSGVIFFANKPQEESRVKNQDIQEKEETGEGDNPYGETKGTTVYVNKSCSLRQIESPEAETMVIDGSVGFFDNNGELEEDREEFIPDPYLSKLRGCPNIKKFQVTKGNFSTSESVGELYCKNNLLMYANPVKGVYACPPMLEGDVKIPKNVWEIYDGAFQDCRKITSLFIPKSVRWVGTAAFGNNTGLTKIKVEKGSKYLKSVNGVLYTRDGRVLLAYPAGKKDKVYNVPKGVRYIVADAFMGAKNLEQINLPEKVFYVGNFAFKDCEKLLRVTAKNKVFFMEPTVYEGCDKIRLGECAKRRKYKGYIVCERDWDCIYQYEYLSYKEKAYPWKDFSLSRRTPKDSIFEFLREFGKISKEIKAKLATVSDVNDWEYLLDAATTTQSLKEFTKQLNKVIGKK